MEKILRILTRLYSVMTPFDKFCFTTGLIFFPIATFLMIVGIEHMWMAVLLIMIGNFGTYKKYDRRLNVR